MDEPLEEMVVPAADDAPWEQGRGEEDPFDEDLIALHAFAPHMLDDLEPLERLVLSARFALNDHPVQSMREIHQELGVSRRELRDALGTGLEKIRRHLLD
ncbi:MAG TPA: hypothetical protein VGA13_08415 [Acidimicrobiales bacterium]